LVKGLQILFSCDDVRAFEHGLLLSATMDRRACPTSRAYQRSASQHLPPQRVVGQTFGLLGHALSGEPLNGVDDVGGDL
jgi:hypothetical protein